MSHSGCVSIQSARFVIARVSEARVLADRRSRTGRSPEGACRATSGASATTTCALVPEKPKEFTAPRRGIPRSGIGHGRLDCGTKKGDRAKSICGFGVER